MQKAQLYIGGQRVEMLDDVNISITDSIQNVRDISKIFTSYSQTFNVPASKTNNKIFKHYYNNDINNGFDARVKVDAILELNSLPFKKGYINLEGVDLRDNKPSRYRLTFFGDMVSLKDLLGDDKLQSLGLSSYDKIYDDLSIRNSLQLDPDTNDVIVPLITHTQRLIYDSANNNHEEGNLYYHTTSGGGGSNKHGVRWNDLKYAIRVDSIIQEISSKYNLDFSNDFFNSSNAHYYNLFMWLHRKKGAVENSSGTNQSIISNWNTTSLGDTLTQMVSNTTLRVSGDVNRYDNYGLFLTSTTTNTYRVSLQKDGVEVYNTGDVTGSVTIEQTDFTIEQGDYTAIIEGESTVVFSRIEWDIEYRTIGGVVENDTYTIPSYTFISQFNFLISQQIPEMKIIDFLTGIFKMFNLTAYVDKNTNAVIVKTLDSFYQSGIKYDITKYIDINNSAVNSALPYKEINFEHEDTKTFLANRHKELLGKTWSKETFLGGQKLNGGTYNVKTPFSQLKYERLIDANNENITTAQVGYYVDDNQDSYLGKPLLFYPIKQTSGTTICFLFNNDTATPQANYIIPSNSVALSSSSSKENMNFYNEVNEYTFENDFTDTLFEVYYKNYIKNIFDVKNRLTKLSAYLPLRILLNYNLSDRFIINNKSYKINSIETNLNSGKSELELLSDIEVSTVDTSNPTTPTNLRLQSSSNLTLNIAWDASRDNVGVTGYDIYVNDILDFSVGNVTSTTIVGLFPLTNYLVRLVAFDAAGNRSLSTANVTMQTG